MTDRIDSVFETKQTPEILLIHLNRSTHYGYSGPIKNSCQVTFPEYLDLAPFCDHSSSSSTLPTTTTPPTRISTRDLYKLSSMVVHYGSHHFGHYVAFRRTPLRSTPSPSSTTTKAKGGIIPEWYRISDETVEISNLDEVLRNNPFLLFYERVKEPTQQLEEEEEEEEKEKGEGGERVKGISMLEKRERLRPRVIESWSVRTRASEKEGKEENDQGGGGAGT